MKGLIYAVSAYAMWGCFPLFFSLLSHIDAMQVLSFRIVFACVFSAALLLLLGQFGAFRKLWRNRSTLLWSLLASVLISLNWYVFIWAVSQHRVVETSLGYFITPLVSLFLGRVLLKESINHWQFAAGAIALAAILFELIALGGVPWVSLVLAFSFGFYGLVRKIQPIDSLFGLTMETLWVLPLALLFLAGVAQQGQLQHDLPSWVLLVLSGVVTAIPLLFFAASVRALNLVVAGFIMYLNPLMQFMTAVWILEEAVPSQRYVTFVMVWIAMACFITGLVRKQAELRRVKRAMSAELAADSAK
ncbi:EamA family transporter RarD [Reinekea blandensis]|uniref:RarD protein n=1 Tax=Reinekea blandensis MED297 TaxID=314283 RepID=A4BFQ6_9GAMM|nr:EamA family transporter RarD [Reinekea blandensis]EAR09151.1 rarD protein [Reinekea sp. MED297] [Reinekea blandensis MED297]